MNCLGAQALIRLSGPFLRDVQKLCYNSVYLVFNCQQRANDSENFQTDKYNDDGRL